MTLLAIETSGFTGGVAIISDHQIRGELIIGSRSTYSRRLLKSIIFLMEEAECTWEDVTEVAVSLGPGSFTGLRIGLATAKGLCLSTGATLFGVPTLDVMAQNGLLSPTPLICPVMDARRGQLYAALYRNKGKGILERVSDYLVVKPQELHKHLPSHERVLFLGPGLLSYRQSISDILGDRALFAPEPFWYPRPLFCGLLALSRREQGVSPDDPISLTPLYLRLSEAEEKKRASEKAS